MSEPLGFSAWMFVSRSADILVPISRFDAQKNCIPPLASHSNSSRTLLYSILSLHPTSRASDLSAPDRRDLRTRTSNLRDQIWVSIPLPPCLLGHYDLDNDIRRSRNAAGNEKTHRLPGSAFPPGRLSGKPSPFHFHPDSSQVENAPWTSCRFIDLSVRSGGLYLPSLSLFSSRSRQGPLFCG